MAYWRIAATVIIFIFTLIVIQSFAAPYFDNAAPTFKEFTENRDYLDGDAAVDGMISSFFDGLLVAGIGIFVWAGARIIKDERFVGRNGPGRGGL